MTLPATAIPFGDRLPDDDERAVADQLRRIIASRAEAGKRVELDLVDAAGETAHVALSPALSDLLMNLLRELSKGNAVTLLPVGEMLTTQQAADLLNVSRPYLTKLIDRGELNCEMVGRHRRISAIDVFRYKAQMQRRQDAALDEIAAADGEFI